MNVGSFVCAMMVVAQVLGSLFGFGSVNVADLLSVKPVQAAEGISHTINYQGRLMDAGGSNVADGDYDMIFVIYDSLTGGNQLWSASTTNGLPTGTTTTVPVAVKSGLFSILLGDTNDNQVAFPENLFNNDELYLGVTVGADAEMQPRKRLSAVPYAYNSETLQGQYASHTVDGTTGGDLFALHQGSDTPASATRTALYVETKGTSESWDFLTRMNNGLLDVFTITRSGNVTTTGSFQVDGTSIIGSATDTPAIFNAYINSDFNPYIDDTYYLGIDGYRWKGLNAVNVTTTNLAADYVTTSELWVDGVQITGGAGSTPNWQQVTDVGATTTNWVQFAGATTTGDILPDPTLSLDLGSSSNRWNDVWASSTRIGSSTWDLWQADEGFMISNNNLANKYFAITNAGKVGVGTTSPNGKLDLNLGTGGNNNGLVMDLTSANGVADQRWSSIDFKSYTSGIVGRMFSTGNTYSSGAINFPANSIGLIEENANGSLVLMNAGASGDIRFNTGGYGTAFERMRILSGGNVGIGDTTPAALFTVGNGDLFQVNSSGRVQANSGASGAGNLAYSFVNDTDTGLYNSLANEMRFQTNGTDRVTINSNGNVGINYTNPWIGNLHVNRSTAAGLGGDVWITNMAANNVGNYARLAFGVDGSGDNTPNVALESIVVNTGFSTADLAFKFWDGSGYNEKMRVMYSGNVGIGDTTPASLFTVGNNDRFQVNSSGRVLADAGASGAGNLAYSFVGDTGTGLYRSAANEMRFQTNASDRITINSSGNFGIGDTSPLALFTVGNGDLFQVDSTGDLIKIRNVTYSWPSSQGGANTYLKNNGSGTLTWETVAGATTPNLQQVTDVGATTTNWIAFNGASSTNHIVPSSTLMYDLGSSAYRWDDIWGQTFHVGSSTWDLYQNADRSFGLGNYLYGHDQLRIDENGWMGISLGQNIDDFDNERIETYWTTSTPAGTITEDDDVLTMECIGICDWWTGGTESSPIITQSLDYDEDFTITTKISSFANTIPQTNAGPIVYKDRNNVYGWILDGNDQLIAFRIVSDIGSVIFTGPTVTNIPLWLRIRRVGTTLYFDYSVNGRDFTNSGSVVQAFTPTSVGLVNKVYSGGNLTTEFDYFELNYTNDYRHKPMAAFDLGGAVNWRGMVEPFTASSSQGIIYFDKNTNKFRVSENGGAYVDLLSGVVDLQVATDNGNTTDNSIIITAATPTALGKVQDAVYLDGPFDIEVIGDLAYTASYNQDYLTIWDVSDRNAPVRLGSLQDGTNLNGAFFLDVEGDYAYITSELGNRFAVVNISSSTNPVLTGSLASDNTNGVYLDGAAGVKVMGDYAYVVSRDDNAFQIIDIKDPSNPVPVSSLVHNGTSRFMSYPHGIDIMGGYAYITGRTSDSLQIVDITDPYNPVAKGFITETTCGAATCELDGAVGIKVMGDYAYIASFDDDGMEIVDISSSTNPIHVGKITDNAAATNLNGAWDIDILGDHAYITGYDDSGLEIVDITDPANPSHFALVNDSADLYLLNAAGLDIEGNYLYVASFGEDGLQIFELNRLKTPIADISLLDSDYLNVSSKLTVGGGFELTGNVISDLLPDSSGSFNLGDADHAWNSLHSNDVDVYASAPVAKGKVTNAVLDYAYGHFVQGDLAYITSFNQDRLTIYDISDPDSPVQLGTLTDATNLNGAYYISVQGDYAFITAEEGNRFAVVDVSNPYQPSLVATLNDGGSVYLGGATGLYISGKYAYVTARDDDALTIIDISDPTVPKHVSSILHNVGANTFLDFAHGVYVKGNYAYVASYTSQAVQIIDVSDPKAPFAAGVICDTSSPSCPVALETAQELNGARNIKVVGNYACVASELDDGVSIIDISSSTAPTEVGYITDAGLTELDGANSIEVIGDYAYVTALEDDGIEVLNISDPAAPSHVAFITDSVNTYLDGPSSISVSGNYLYTTSRDEDGFQIFKLNTVKAVTADIGHLFSTDLEVKANATIGNDLYVNSAIHTDEIFGRNLYSNDIFNTNNVYVSGTTYTEELWTKGITLGYKDPVYKAGVDYSGANSPSVLDVQGSYVYAAEYGDITVFDISDKNNPEIASVITQPATGVLPSLVVSGKYLYLGSTVSTEEFSIYDISNPASAVRLGDVDTGIDSVYSIELIDKYAYAGQANGDIGVIDVSVPESIGNSKLVYTLDLGANIIRAIKRQGNYVYVGTNNGTGNADLFVLDVSNPALPTVATSVNVGANYVMDLQPAGRYLYLTTLNGDPTVTEDFIRYDISNPVAPVYSDGINLDTSTAYNVKIYNKYAYVSFSDASLSTGANQDVVVIDISSTTSMTYVGGANTDDSQPFGMAIEGRYLYVNTYNGTGTVDFRIYDIGGVSFYAAEMDSLQSDQLWVTGDADVANNLFVGTRLEVGHGGLVTNGGVVAMATSSLANTLPHANYTYDLGSWDYNWRNIYASGTSYLRDIWSVNIDADNPSDASLVQKYAGALPAATTGDIYSIDVDGTYMYVAGAGTGARMFSIYDYTNPASPSFVGEVTFSRTPRYVKVQGDYAYVWLDGGLGGQDYLATVDIRNRANPSVVANFSTNISADVQSLDVVGHYVYFLIGDSIYIYDAADPANMNTTPVATIATGGTGPKGIDVYQGYAYIANYNSNNISVIDVKNPLNPSLVTTLATANGPVGISIEGGYAYVHHQNSANTLSVINVKNPASPSVVATLDLAGYAYGDYADNIEVHGRYAYLSCATGNIGYIIDVSNPASPVLVASESLGSTGLSIAVDGKNVFWGYSSRSVEIHGLGGIETNSLLVDTARMGSLLVSGSASISDDLSILGDLHVGTGGVHSNGPLSAGATSTLVNVLPYLNNSYDLGTYNTQWRNIYATGTSYLDDIWTRNIDATNIDAAHVVKTDLISSGYGEHGSVVVRGDYAYQAVNRYLQIYNVSDPSNVILVTSTSINPQNSSARANGIRLHGNYAIISNDLGDVSVVDITYPPSPYVVATYYHITDAERGFDVSGNYLFVPHGNNLEIYDLTSAYSDYQNTYSFGGYSYPPATIRAVPAGSVNTGGAGPVAVHVEGHLAYVTNYTSGTVSIINASNPKDPVLIATSTVAANVSSIFVKSGYIYTMAVGSSNLYITDATNPYSPFLAATLNIGTQPSALMQTAQNIEAVGDYVYISGYNSNRLVIVDASSSTAPVVLNQTTLDGVGGGLAVSGRNVYVSQASYLGVYDVGGIETHGLNAYSAKLGNLNVQTNAVVNNDLDVGGSLSVGNGGIISNGPVTAISEFQYVTTVSVGLTGTSGPFDVDVYDNMAYVVNNNEGTLTVMDVSDPSQASIVTTTYSGFFGTLPIKNVVRGNYLYVYYDNSSNNFKIFNITDPVNPVLAGSLTVTPGSYNGDLKVMGDYAYLVRNNSLYVINIHNPQNPYIASSLALVSGVTGLFIQDNFAYVAAGYGNRGLYIVDIRNPLNPVNRGNLVYGGTNNPNDVAVKDNYAYVAGTEGSDIRVVDITDKDNPVEVATVDFSGIVHDFEIQGDCLYVSNEMADNAGAQARIWIYNISDPENIYEVKGVMPIQSYSPRGIKVYKGYLYSAHYGHGTGGYGDTPTNKVGIYKLAGFKGMSIDADVGDFGDLAVEGSMTIGSQLSIQGGLHVGINGIITNGGLAVQSTSTFSDIQIFGYINNDLLPLYHDTFWIGTSTRMWKGLAATTVSTTQLIINGVPFNGLGIAGTDNRIVRMDGTDKIQDSLIVLDDTGNLYPVNTNSQDLGLATNRWDDVWGATFHVGTSTWNITQAVDGNFSLTKSGFGYGTIWDNGDNIAFGYRSGEAIGTGQRNVGYGSYTLGDNDFGNDNTGIGYAALSSAGSGESFSFNTGVGSNVMANLETGSYNTGIGARALFNNISGATNTAIGFGSLYSLTNGNNNVAIGDSAMYSNSSLSGLVAIGSGAMYSNVAGVSNLAIGASALYANTNGKSNTAVGYAALSGAGGSHSYNTAMGSLAMNLITTGSYNSVFGADAMRNITTGASNTAVGAESLYLNDTGSQNTALGSRALYSNTAGIRNTITGSEAAYDLNGSYNTFNGSQSARNFQTGNYNTGLGYRAVYGNASGANASYNTGIGSFSLGLLTTGASNTAVGYASLFNNTTGESNTAVGTESLYLNTTGSYNTAQGFWAMRANTSGSNNAAYGWASLFSNQTGNYNTGLGGSNIVWNTNGLYNTGVGYEALNGNEGDSGWSYNTGIGARSLYGLTTGASNTAVGFESLLDLTTGSYNVSIGTNSMDSAVFGSWNVAIGAKALSSYTNPYSVTAIGYMALASSTSGNQTAVGSNALRHNTTGDFNTAVGTYSMQDNTTGDENDAFGHYALNNNTTGSGNSAFGYRSLNYNATGTYNTALGNYALYSDDGDTGNTAVGYSAAHDLENGDYNVFIGYEAARYTTRGSSSTYIGYDTGGHSFYEYNNAMALGAGARVDASDHIRLGNDAIKQIGGIVGFSNLSDVRIKENIENYNVGLDFILDLQPRRFEMINWDDRKVEGFIAQEVKDVMDSHGITFSGYVDPAIDGAPADSLKSLTYGQFVVPLVNAVQEIYASSSPLWAKVQIDQNGDVAVGDTVIKPQDTATSSTQAFDSYTFSYMGSAWNSSTSQAITTSFDVFNNTIHASSSELKFIYTTGTGFTQELLTITNAGDMHVSGDLHVGRRLYLGSKTTGESSTGTYIFVDDTLAPTSTYIATNADGWQTETTYDYAERYESLQELEPGDLVTTDASGVNLVKRATSPSDPLLGIVSTKPGFVTGRHYDGWYPIALAGRVPTRVSTINGAIRVGDYITASENSGVGVKAIGPGNVIGIALEAYDSPEEGLISVFVKPSYTAGVISNETETAGTIVYNNTTIEAPVQRTEIEGLATIRAGATEVHISYGSILAYPMIYANPHASLGGSWWITNRTDTGFDIILSQPENHDIEFTWMARPMNPGTIRFVSDNTYHNVDNLTAHPIGPTQEELLEDETTTSTDPIAEPPTEDPVDTATSSSTLSVTEVENTDASVSSTAPVTGGETATSTDAT